MIVKYSDAVGLAENPTLGKSVNAHLMAHKLGSWTEEGESVEDHRDDLIQTHFRK